MIKENIIEITLLMLLVLANSNNLYMPLLLCYNMIATILITFTRDKFTYEKQIEYNDFADKKCPHPKDSLGTGRMWVAG